MVVSPGNLFFHSCRSALCSVRLLSSSSPFNITSRSCRGLECAEYPNHVLEDPHSGVGKPAAVIVEPIQGEGGSIVPPVQFIPRVRQICDQHEVVMIADEVQAGFCRTGKVSFEHTQTVPDVVTMSKALGGIRSPISGIAYREKFNPLPAGQHIGAFRGNVTASSRVCSSGVHGLQASGGTCVASRRADALGVERARKRLGNSGRRVRQRAHWASS